MSGICDTCKRNQDCRRPMDGMDSCRLYVSGKESNYEKLVGTPERAARTLQEFELDHLNWCHGTDGCEKCPYEFDRYGCYLPDGFELLEWLRGDA